MTEEHNDIVHKKADAQEIGANADRFDGHDPDELEEQEMNVFQLFRAIRRSEPDDIEAVVLALTEFCEAEDLADAAPFKSALHACTAEMAKPEPVSRFTIYSVFEPLLEEAEMYLYALQCNLPAPVGPEGDGLAQQTIELLDDVCECHGLSNNGLGKPSNYWRDFYVRLSAPWTSTAH